MNQSYMRNIYGINIRALRKAHGISQSSLSESLKIKQSFLSAIETGRSRLPAAKREALVDLFGEDEIMKFSSPSRIGVYADNAESSDRSVPESETEMMTRLLRMFHNQEHREENHNHAAHHELIERMQRHVDSLLESNERLLQANERLQRSLDTIIEQNRLLQLRLDSMLPRE